MSLRLFPLVVFSLGLVFLAGCGSDGAKEPPRWSPNPQLPPRDENYHGGPNAMLLKYAGKDGSLTRAELTAGLKSDFDGYDTGHTGCLDQDRVRAINAARIAADQSAATPLQDWNQDGCVDFSEFAAAPFSLFDQLDRNGDGKITPQEFGKKAAAETPAPAAPHTGRRRGGSGQSPPQQ